MTQSFTSVTAGIRPTDGGAPFADNRAPGWWPGALIRKLEQTLLHLLPAQEKGEVAPCLRNFVQASFSLTSSTI